MKRREELPKITRVLIGNILYEKGLVTEHD